MVVHKKEVILRPSPKREAELKKALFIPYWTKARFERLKRNLVVHSNSKALTRSCSSRVVRWNPVG